ncbi:MAG: 3-octaprenyl-4-hydroxybenzoate carboxy-lyase [Bacteroidetes bacterium]|nr:MAG: 3-octaprenyl-4-hydroxybenzoate carboxy-lyase [Bacteroidota bacterium]
MEIKNGQDCVEFLERKGELVRISCPVDPYLEMAQITRQVFAAKGPAILFEQVKGSPFPALSNVCGTYERALKLLEPQLSRVQTLMDMAVDPGEWKDSPFHLLKKGAKAANALFHALPIKVPDSPVTFRVTRIDQLPQVQSWARDGGAFLTLPQVFSQEPGKKNILASNLGMYRVQLSGNQYIPNEEVGLHYQLHRGIGNHHQKALEMGKPLPVSIFLGGPLAHTLAAIMPLPEGMSELGFAGALAGRNFRYIRKNDFVLSGDADFCITGYMVPGKVKPEGPFGDHLGYYSQTHDYPYLTGVKVYHRPGAVFPFTVVGRPPQEDSVFGRLIHELTRKAIQKHIPGVVAINAVDDAGVHSLLLAKARERYVPYEKRQPRELMTHALAILGGGQLSLTKYLMMAAHEDAPNLAVSDEKAFLSHVLSRVNFSRDLHFITRTTQDTLDYTSGKINRGSRLVITAAGDPVRDLSPRIPEDFSLPPQFCHPGLAASGMMVIQGPEFRDYPSAQHQMRSLIEGFEQKRNMEEIPLVVIVDDAEFAGRSFANFLWVTFLRSNPSHDVYGAFEKVENKHWGCASPMVIDARVKPFHAEVLQDDSPEQKQIQERILHLAAKGGPLHGVL